MRMRYAYDNPLESFCPSKISDVQKSEAIIVDASKREKRTVSPAVDKCKRRNYIAPNLDGHVIVDNTGNRGVDVECEDAATRVNERLWRDEERLGRLDLHKALLERDARRADGKIGQCVKRLPRQHPSHVHVSVHFRLKLISAVPVIGSSEIGAWNIHGVAF